MKISSPDGVTRLHLLRHGETDWNAEGRIQGQSESLLTEAGRAQAMALQAELRDRGISRVFSSSSLRARQTAAIVFAGMAQEIHYLDALREIALGSWEGHLYSTIEALYPEHLRAFREVPDQFRFQGAETFAELQARGVAAVEEIALSCPGQAIAVVSHGALIRSVLSHYGKRPLSRLWEPPKMHNCAHSIIEIVGAAEPRIVQYAGQSSW